MAYSSAFSQSTHAARPFNNNSRSESESLNYSIISYLGRLSAPDHAGWCKELNLVSWNNGQPRYDIRSWSQSHERMSKGIGLNVQELVYLYFSLEHLRCVDQHFAALIDKVARMSSATLCASYQQQDPRTLLPEQPNSWNIPNAFVGQTAQSNFMSESGANTSYSMANNGAAVVGAISNIPAQARDGANTPYSMANNGAAAVGAISNSPTKTRAEANTSYSMANNGAAAVGAATNNPAQSNFMNEAGANTSYSMANNGAAAVGAATNNPAQSSFMNEAGANTSYSLANNGVAAVGAITNSPTKTRAEANTPYSLANNDAAALGAISNSPAQARDGADTSYSLANNGSMVESNDIASSELGAYGVASLLEEDDTANQEPRTSSDEGNLGAVTSAPANFAQEGAE